jgi:alanyl-tRNA synthetase
MSGETGPCGPSVGIFVDGSNNQDGVNGKFIEISRIVFVEVVLRTFACINI